MRTVELVREVRFEVEKPFEEKLRRAKELLHIFVSMCPPGKCVVACSFGKDSLAVLHLALQEDPGILVLFENTGVQHGETYKFKDRLTKDWSLNLIETKPLMSFWQIADKYGLPDGTKKGADQCCAYLKILPFRKLVKKHGWKVCFTGLTALESRLRMFTICNRGQEYYAQRDGLTKVHPIVFWTPEEVLGYLHENKVPLNPVYKKYGVERTGCVPCTSHRIWREQMRRTNPKMYKYIQETYFNQKLLDGYTEDRKT